MEDKNQQEDILLCVEDLNIQYETSEFTAKAVNGISFELRKGETLGLVGETGAGKTTTALSIIGLLPKETARIIGGRIWYRGKNLLEYTEEQMREIKGGEIGMIYQDPMTSLNPVMTVGEQVSESLKYHSSLNKNEIEKRTNEIFELVGLPSKRKNDYPHQFSGGMKQRIVIAMALACNPNLLIADEPTTALDVTIQAQVLKMMNDIKEKLGSGVIFITHDLGIIVRMCQKVAVLYAGEIVECGTTKEIFTCPTHPYTKGLFGSIPNLKQKVERLQAIPGLMADAANLPEGCKFHPRCGVCLERCRKELPKLQLLGGTHYVRCHQMEGGN